MIDVILPCVFVASCENKAGVNLMKSKASTLLSSSIVGGAALVAIAFTASDSAAISGLNCPLVSPQVSESPTTLQNYATSNGAANGVVWSGSASQLQLKKEGGFFKLSTASVNANPYYMCTADFDGDGFPDLATMRVRQNASTGDIADHSDLRLFRNDSKQQEIALGVAAPFSAAALAWWSDPTHVITPKFTPLDKNGNLYTTVTPTSGANKNKIVETSAGPIDNYSHTNTTGCNAPLPPTDPAANTAGCGGLGGTHGSAIMGCGDFDMDGKADIIVIATVDEGTVSDVYRADVYRGNGNNTFKAKYSLAGTAPTQTALNKFKGMFGDGVLLIHDMNTDGRNDLVMASSGGTVVSGSTNYTNNHGVVRSYINDCTTLPCNQPKVGSGEVRVAELVQQNSLAGSIYGNSGNNGFQSVVIADFNSDGIRDIAANGIRDSRVRVYYGLGNPANPSFPATASLILNDASKWNGTGGQALMAEDFNLDGKVDIGTSTDRFRTANSAQQPRYLYWQNSGPPNFFSTTTVTGFNNLADGSSCKNGICTGPDPTGVFADDSDTGFTLDYDQDPNRTADLAITDGNTNAKIGVFANRVQSSTFVTCGDIYSEPADIGGLASQAAVITGARITPNWTIPSGMLPDEMPRLEGTNEDPPKWVPAKLCPTPAGNTSEWCVTFPKPVGKKLRWKVHMCSNANRTASTTITNMSLNFTYEQGDTHFRAGAVADNHVVYVGAFSLPGEFGHLFGMPASLGPSYFDALSKIDTAPQRRVYTTKIGGKISMNFDGSQVSLPDFVAALGVASPAIATSIVNWWTGMRFGADANNVPNHKFGAVVESTPAVVGAPVKPYYYNFLTGSAKTEIDAYLNAPTSLNRPKLVLVGSKDGALHAINSDTADIPCLQAPFSGTEAWAFIPREVAAGFASDQANGAVSSYVDGAVTLADIKVAGAYQTVAVFGLGNGGRSISALKVTNTVANTKTGTCTASQTVTGPVPLWEYKSNDFGQTRSKPVVARVSVGGVEKFLAIVASGIDSSNTTAPWTKGQTVEAINMDDGTLQWKFKAKCPVTTDVAANPILATGGFVTEVFFGDYCGNIYRVPANGVFDAAHPFVAGSGTVTVGTNDDATPIKAVFHVGGKGNIPAGEDRPIVGTIAVSRKLTTDTTPSVYFGTGGDENFTQSKPNAFFEINGGTGSVIDVKLGGCTGSICEKFYGGIAVTDDKVFLTKATDPVIGSSDAGLCRGSSVIAAFNTTNFSQAFSQTFNSSNQSAVFASSDGIYATNLAGEVIRVHTSVTNAGGGGTGGTGGVAGVSLKRRNWRQVY
jgi:hypothetical protein